MLFMWRDQVRFWVRVTPRYLTDWQGEIVWSLTEMVMVGWFRERVIGRSSVFELFGVRPFVESHFEMLCMSDCKDFRSDGFEEQDVVCI